MNNTPNVADLLRRNMLFERLEPSEVELLAREVRVQNLATGEALFDQGDAADRFYLVQDGRIKLYRLSAAGQEKIVEVFGPGETFAEAVMFMERKAYPVNAAALVPTTVLAIPNGVYKNILGGNARACFRLLGDMSMRLHRRLNDIDGLTLHSATERVAGFLLRELPAPDSDRLSLGLPKQVIASRLAVTPETLSRVLGNLSDAGIVEVEGKEVRVLDREALERAAREPAR